MEKSCTAYFFSWPEAFQAGVEAAGGKGWNLGRLERYGFKIPAGGVLAAGAYRNFIEENNLMETTGKIAQSVSIGNIGEREIEEKLFLIREKISNILSAIKGCYASLWTLRAVAYRRKMSVKDDDVIPAVVIMEMVDAKAAGMT